MNKAPSAWAEMVNSVPPVAGEPCERAGYGSRPVMTWPGAKWQFRSETHGRHRCNRRRQPGSCERRWVSISMITLAKADLPVD